jgi:hypothetical protein
VRMQKWSPTDQSETGISEASLRGRQSVRTTFRLPVYLIELLGIVAEQFGLKQKSLFDQLIEDNEVLYEIAENFSSYAPDNIERRTKTYVLSKQSLRTLERVSVERQIPRDMLMEVSIRRLLPVLLAEREKHYKRTKILDDMQQYLLQGKKLLDQAENLLGSADPLCDTLGRMVRLGEESVMNLADTVAKGKIMETVRVERFLRPEQTF